MKKKFKIGDLVKHSILVGTGEVVHFKWPRWYGVKWNGHVVTLHTNDLELAETPIERMKRRYSEY